MLFGSTSLWLSAAVLLLAMAFGAILALIAVELRARARRNAHGATRALSNGARHSDEEKKRRQDVVVRLMELYSGVHSSDALSDFLNKELERRHEVWRVRIPMDGPGEIYDLDAV
jgi:hypothetical protein